MELYANFYVKSFEKIVLLKEKWSKKITILVYRDIMKMKRTSINPPQYIPLRNPIGV